MVRKHLESQHSLSLSAYAAVHEQVEKKVERTPRAPAAPAPVDDVKDDSGNWFDGCLFSCQVGSDILHRYRIPVTLNSQSYSMSKKS